MSELDEDGVTVQEPERASYAESASTAKLAAALAAATPNIKSAIKAKLARINSDKGNFQFKYADLESIQDAAADALAAQGLTVVQPARLERGGVLTVATKLQHASGEYITSGMTVEVGAKVDPKQIGIWTTYLRKYGYASMVGIAWGDDPDARGGTQSTHDDDAPRNAPATKPTKAVTDMLVKLELVKSKPAEERHASLAVLLKEIKAAPKDLQEAVREKYGEVNTAISGNGGAEAH